MLDDTILFYVFGGFAVAASLLVVGQRSPIYSVLLLIGSFAALAGLYVLLDAPFLAVIQIIIYAGAIMVLFLFVVMLLNAPYETSAGVVPPGGPLQRPRRLGVLLGVVVGLELLWALWRASGEAAAGVRTDAGRVGDPSSVAEIGRVLFTEYAFAFEVSSILIIVALVGAVVLAKRDLEPPSRERARR